MPQNALGYVLDKEMVDAEFLFCRPSRLGASAPEAPSRARGGYVKVKHLKAQKARGENMTGSSAWDTQTNSPPKVPNTS